MFKRPCIRSKSTLAALQNTCILYVGLVIAEAKISANKCNRAPGMAKVSQCLHTMTDPHHAENGCLSRLPYSYNHATCAQRAVRWYLGTHFTDTLVSSLNLTISTSCQSPSALLEMATFCTSPSYPRVWDPDVGDRNAPLLT